MYVCIGGGDEERGIVWQRKFKTYFFLESYWGWSLRVCISNISQVMLMLLVWDHILKNIALKLNYLLFLLMHLFCHMDIEVVISC